MYDNNRIGNPNQRTEVIGSKLGPANTTITKKRDTAYCRKNMNNWEIIFGVNESGKLTITGWKTIGKLRGEESKLHFTLETTSNRVPSFVKTNYYNARLGGYKPFVEVDDAKDRVTSSYKDEEKYHKRVFHKGSILTTEEFLSEQVPNFEELLKDKRLNEYIIKVAEECSQMQKPYNRDYVAVNSNNK